MPKKETRQHNRKKMPRDWSSLADFEESIPFVGLSSEDIENFDHLQKLKDQEMNAMKQSAWDKVLSLSETSNRHHPPEIQEKIARLTMSKMEVEIERHIEDIADFYTKHASAEEWIEGDIESWRKWKNEYYVEIAKRYIEDADPDFMFRTDDNHASKIKMPPGSLIARLFSAILPRKLYENTIEQMIGDFREEYFHLLRESNGKTTSRMRYLSFLLLVNCSWCTLRMITLKLLALDSLWEKISKQN